jgi:uncharacterized glyoxalase superfamily protein PhnB
MAMDLTIYTTFLPHTDPDASLAFYRDVLGFEVRTDVGYGGMRWITIGPADQPGVSIVLEPPAADPGITDDERRTIAEMMAKGTYAMLLLATKDLDGTFERLQASDAEVVQEPTEQPYGVRDCAFRDPAATLGFYRDTLGFEVRNDVEYGGMHWITVGPADQPGTSIVLYPPAASPGVTDDERRTIAEMMAKGTYASINLATSDLDGAFERLQASDGADIVQEPTEQPYGIRDCAVRDPAGNLVRIQEVA